MQENFLKKCLESFQILQKENRGVAILGGGITGLSLQKFFQRKEIPCFILDSMKSGEKKEYFADTSPISDLPSFSLVLKSPGIKPSHPFLEKARESKIPVWSEVQLARIFFRGKVIGITGTDGKSTTTALTTHLISGEFPKTRMGGNIGTAFIEFCEEDLDFAVLELSSYQLEDSIDLGLESAALLNIANDHLERHKTMENYIQAKMKIFSWTNPRHTAILNSRQNVFPVPEKYECRLKYFGTDKLNQAMIQSGGGIQTEKAYYNTDRFPLIGFHNLENLASAILLAESVGVNSKMIQERLETFEGLKHRFQKLTNWKGKEFINDSKSTNLHSMLAGIKGFRDEFFILILGGIPKEEPLEPFLHRLKELNVKILMFGESPKLWKRELENYCKQPILEFKDLPALMDLLFQKLNDYPPCKILFSPAGASFDLYKNFEERGEDFIRLVKEFTGST